MVFCLVCLGSIRTTSVGTAVPSIGTVIASICAAVASISPQRLLGQLSFTQLSATVLSVTVLSVTELSITEFAMIVCKFVMTRRLFTSWQTLSPEHEKGSNLYGA